ncbi:MAG: DUF4293 family protein [Bacteroidales bacterium]|nr:DUF4293 family protein [Bacteroidales bacterium]MBQ6688554.1 DUF4293 family protein [Bacteroidales bacterium]
MWQRIQTLFIGISTLLAASLFFCRFATILGPEGTEEVIRYYEKTPYLILMIMTLTANICALFSYKMRFLQARVCIISALLMVGMQVWFAVDFIKYHNEIIFSVTMLFPIAGAILNLLAARSAMIDEMTLQAVRSARRVRKRK